MNPSKNPSKNPSRSAPKTLSAKDVRAVTGGVAVSSSLKAGLVFQKITYNTAEP